MRVLGEVLLGAVLDVVVEGEDRLPRVGDPGRADRLELLHHRARCCRGSSRGCGRMETKSPARTGRSGGPSASVRLGDLLDDRLSHRALLPGRRAPSSARRDQLPSARVTSSQRLGAVQTAAFMRSTLRRASAAPARPGRRTSPRSRRRSAGCAGRPWGSRSAWSNSPAVGGVDRRRCTRCSFGNSASISGSATTSTLLSWARIVGSMIFASVNCSGVTWRSAIAAAIT